MSKTRFGAIKLYIPKHWKVLDNLSVNLGGVENKNHNGQLSADAPCLTLKGNVQFGAVEIYYI